MRSGGSYSGLHPPSPAARANQTQLLNHARRVATKARQDASKIQKDYDDDLQKFVDYHGRQPTDQELVTAAYENTRDAATEDDYHTAVDQAFAGIYDAHDDAESEAEADDGLLSQEIAGDDEMDIPSIANVSVEPPISRNDSQQELGRY